MIIGMKCSSEELSCIQDQNWSNLVQSGNTSAAIVILSAGTTAMMIWIID